MQQFTLSPDDWRLVGTFMCLVLFSLGFQVFGGWPLMALLELICGVCAVLMTFDALARLFFRSM